MSGNWVADCRHSNSSLVKPCRSAAKSIVPSSGCPREPFSTAIFDLHGNIRRAFTESRTWNERPIAKTVPEAVGWSVPLVVASKQILREKALAKCQVVDPSAGDAIREGMLSPGCPSFYPVANDRPNLNIASLFALPEAENYFAEKVIHI
jgi:hypothetical protein